MPLAVFEFWEGSEMRGIGWLEDGVGRVACVVASGGWLLSSQYLRSSSAAGLVAGAALTAAAAWELSASVRMIDSGLWEGLPGTAGVVRNRARLRRRAICLLAVMHVSLALHSAMMGSFGFVAGSAVACGAALLVGALLQRLRRRSAQ